MDNWIADAHGGGRRFVVYDRNYLSIMLSRSFKDLEWHKEKKHRRQPRRLNLLPRGLLVTSRHKLALCAADRLPIGQRIQIRNFINGEFVEPVQFVVIPSEVENGAAREAATWTGRRTAERTGSERIKSLDISARSLL